MKLYSIVWQLPADLSEDRMPLNVNIFQLDWHLNHPDNKDPKKPNLFFKNSIDGFGCIWGVASDVKTNAQLASTGRLFSEEQKDIIMGRYLANVEIDPSHGTIEAIEVCEVND